MAERKLNIHAPLMSVRRSSATSPSLTEAKKKILEKRNTLPNYKSDSSMDLVTEPVAVPFNWEHIPGRRKGNAGSQPSQPPKEASMAPSPRLPPGKSANSTRKPVEKESKVTSRFKSTNKSNSSNVNVVRLDCHKERKEEKRVSNVQMDDDVDDDIFSDALEKLSLTGSFSMNCSASGVSGLDNLDAKKSGTFSTDPQTRDFMMSRFLPAAKAMTLQPPQYASRKHSGPLEQPREIKKLVPEEKKPLLNKHVSAIIPYTGPPQEEESEDEDKDKGDRYEESADISAKGCGLIPQLRIGNSMCSLNSVPGVKTSNQAPLAITYQVEKPAKSSNRRSFSPVPAVKKAWEAISKKKSSSRASSPEKPEVRKKWASESNRFNYSGELQQPGRLSPFRRSRAAAAGLSPCRSRPQSPYCGATMDPREAVNNLSGQLKFLQKGHVSIQKMLSQEGKKGLTVEKTLYIDTASTVKLSSANSSSVDNTEKTDTENCPSRKSSQDIKKPEALEGKGMLDSADAKSSILSNNVHTRFHEEKAEQQLTNKKFNREYASSLVVHGKTGEDSNINKQQIVVAENLGNGKVDSGPSPLPPPLPKSPSESWLWRALPLVSVKSSLQHSHQGIQPQSKRPDSNTTSSNPKWETIVKTSNLHHDHVRYSQELTTRKSQHLKA
ncbi:uncharacterized protein LOC114740266 [Neltuma alba]|uniref:uncharacterized protein LOC114727263 n=1 Tax=Neltuma alba TaxID=207710 RepID=UPI0010A56219|nr:uncharacterized protein LOC114727263 [Prosopis alba]XP_028769796.1 uncharacterized protein LOC114727263 [Prosopis alba]XP_028784220.1 uncharacterized protein LOC114740266 [Prosopis alba]XP_028784221.1 uncharacterized protein LOC114740266 [Prosopis alba]